MNPVTVLDGGVGHLLKSRGIQTLCPDLAFDDLFVAGSVANVKRPELVEQVHREYIEAGADVITTNTFACTKWNLAKVGMEGEALEMAIAGARIAREVASSASRPVLVAGSMPPLQESYQVRTTEEFEVMQAEYKELAAALAGYTDVLLCETMSSRAEGLAATTAAASTGCPWWVSFTVQDNKKGLLRSGERLGDAIIEVGRVVGIEAALVNCCTPNSVLAALPILAQNVPQGVRYGGYANGFRQSTSEWRGEGGSDDPEQLEEGREAAEDYDNGKDGIITPSAYARYARLWLQEGATIVGGCCGIGPAHIACVSQF